MLTVTASPITNHSSGRTFGIALSVLGVGALAQFAVVGWAFAARFHAQPAVANVAPNSESATYLARLNPPAPALGMPPDFGADPFSEPPEGAPAASVPALPPKPTPVPATVQKTPDAPPSNRFEELIANGKLLRERGDTSTALTRFREAVAMNPRSPQGIAEIAITYEKMALLDKAGEQWRRVYDMGDAAGVYFSLAEAKLKETQARAVQQALSQTPAAPGDPEEIAGIAKGATVGLLEVASEDQTDDLSAKKFTLHVPIKARPGAKIDVRELVIHVLFYDIVDGQNVVQTSANVNSRWLSAPADWADSDTEELAVQYQLPKPDPRSVRRENRKYFGYIVRVYYRGQLQGAAAEPQRLAQQYPAPPTLPPKEIAQ